MRGNPVRRMIIGGLMAYALIAHALIMGIVTAPTVAAENRVLAALQVICSSSSHVFDDEIPAPSPAHAQHCALCGLGHPMLAAPDISLPLAPGNSIQVAWAHDAGEILLQRARMREQQPRGPPPAV